MKPHKNRPLAHQQTWETSFGTQETTLTTMNHKNFWGKLIGFLGRPPIVAYYETHLIVKH
jgi:hypothetical protein